MFLNYYTFTIPPALSSIRQTHACSTNSNASPAKHVAFALSHIIMGPYIWNSIPQDCEHSATLSSFESKLKRFLFPESFS